VLATLCAQHTMVSSKNINENLDSPLLQNHFNKLKSNNPEKRMAADVGFASRYAAASHMANALRAKQWLDDDK